jgi:hypothetical protein
MIANDHELRVTLARIAHFQTQVAHLRKVDPIRPTTMRQLRDFSPKLTACG